MRTTTLVNRLSTRNDLHFQETPSFSGGASTPTEAAQAQDSSRDGGADATEAAPAGGVFAREEEQSSAADAANETPTEARRAFQVGDVVRVIKGTEADGLIYKIGQTGAVRAIAKSMLNAMNTMAVALEDGSEIMAYADEIEMYETPTEPLPLVFQVGDRVRIKEGLKGPAGHYRKCCGREGTVTAMYYDGHYEVEINTGPVNVHADEMDLIESAGDSKAIEMDEKPAQGNRPAAKYQHPENTDLQWTGRGRKPKWVEHCLAEGRTLTDLEISA